MKHSFSIVLLRPEIPHNTGAIGRLCVGLGVPLHLVRPLGFALDDRYVARAGLDYWPHLDVTLHDTWDEYLAAAKPKRLFFLSTFKIPMPGEHARSINLANAVSIAAYECYRQIMGGR